MLGAEVGDAWHDVHRWFATDLARGNPHMHPRHACRRLFAVVALAGLVVAATVTDSPVAGAATDANRSYVSALYGDLLERTNTSANTAGVEFWANRLETHPRLQVARSIQYATNEYFGKLVDVNYAIYLDRSADPKGRNFLVRGWMARRFTYERVIATLVGSTEYFRLAGRTNTGFVDKAFADILGREPSASVENFFVGVAATRGRATVAVLLATSHEAETALIRFQYESFLGRRVDGESEVLGRQAVARLPS